MFFVFHVFSLCFLYVPWILLRFLVSFQCFLRLCGLFLSIRCTFCCIPSSCFADFTSFFNFTFVPLHFAIMFCNFEICSFQLAICWSHFPMFTPFLDMSISFLKIDLPNIHCICFCQANLTTKSHTSNNDNKNQP